MDPIQGERRNVVFSVRGDEKGVVIDQLNILLSSKLSDPLIQLLDAFKPLRRGIRLLRKSTWPAGRNGSNHHSNVVLFCVLYHSFDVTGSYRELPSGIHIIRAGQNMHYLGLQGVDVCIEGRSDLARRLPNNPQVEPVILSESCLLSGPIRVPVKSDGIADEEHRRVNPKTCSTPRGEKKK